MGGGVLPFSRYNNTIYFLFGREYDSKDWSDFGGGREGDETERETAVREGFEELSGFLGDIDEMNDKINNHYIKISEKGYHTFLMKINYDENLPMYYNNNYQFIKKRLSQHIGKKGLFEKDKIKWISLEEVRTEKYQFRKFYKNIIKRILRLFD